ncbi:MAG: hypothetical protein ABI627_02370 [Polyangiaceae bacterium]
MERSRGRRFGVKAGVCALTWVGAVLASAAAGAESDAAPQPLSFRLNTPSG